MEYIDDIDKDDENNSYNEYVDDLMNDELNNEDNSLYRQDFIKTLIEVGLLNPDGTPVEHFQQPKPKNQYDEVDKFPHLKPTYADGLKSNPDGNGPKKVTVEFYDEEMEM